MKTRQDYLQNLQKGNLVAFRNKDEMYSGTVQEVSNKVTVKTNNGSVYFIDKQDITWVKNGTSWPIGIYNALKETRKGKR